MAATSIRIGGASGFWGDSSVGAPQLVREGRIDFLVFDYLAELTMSLLAGARRRNPALGYATDFVDVAMRSVLSEVAAQGIRVISNAGGVNPQACAQALRALADEAGISLRIAVVEGDDVLAALPALRDEGVRNVQTGGDLPADVLTANAYLGALPIRAALDAGAQVVITGRCVDSAVTLGALMHAFDWTATDYDRLAQGSLAGHILECGCQATGGLFTDWRSVPGWDNIGYPIVECTADGSFVVTKPEGTGGLVSPATVGEQILYEIGDPARYLLPDVICDFTDVTLTQAGQDQVRVSGARGLAPTASYKVSATYLDGFRANARLSIVGMEAADKARRTADAILARVRRLFAEQGFEDFTDTHVEILGTEAAYGPHATPCALRDATLHLAVTHPQKAALACFSREIAPAGTSWAPGTTGVGGRPQVSPSIRQAAFLIDKARVHPHVHLDGVAVPMPAEAMHTPASAQVTGPSGADTPAADIAARLDDAAGLVEVPLIRIAHGRSGDKGDISNVGLIARTPALLPWLRAQATPPAVGEWLAHLVQGPITRYDLPGLHAINLVCERALGGGGMASLRNDPLGKGMAQVVLAMPVRVPAALLP
ncbi:DUF1446 domain-containing protein [Achromobacter sp. GG226]|uniref:acyclic terpene utilization AtuA family protein n=1 Tax=Verticiella alkaliphila TaxID=2779529 RepID=UPI001C0AAB49|nr:acyclic terpene utilization AtuA family protein [Verticiella sp. GG226]MBU4611139.1 DUF1446 domain-containing protein [Verticiella sp. GG226]